MNLDETNVDEVMKSIPDYFNAEKAKGMSAVIQCNFSGSQASNWVIKIENQKCMVNEGFADDPDLTIKADAVNGAKILTGKMDAMRAYMLGKVKVLGDLSLGMKLPGLFDMHQ